MSPSLCILAFRSFFSCPGLWRILWCRSTSWPRAKDFVGPFGPPGYFLRVPLVPNCTCTAPLLAKPQKNDQRTTNSTKRIQYIALPRKSSYSRIGIVRKELFLVYTCGRAFANCTCTVPPSGDLQKVIKRKAPATKYMQSQTNLEKGEGRKR